ncbi:MULTISPECIES: transposase [unclassified Bradyrhizobium]
MRTVDGRHRRATTRRQKLPALPRRWVVERTFAWFGRCRRLAKISKVLPPPNSLGCSLPI